MATYGEDAGRTSYSGDEGGYSAGGSGKGKNARDSSGHLISGGSNKSGSGSSGTSSKASSSPVVQAPVSTGTSVNVTLPGGVITAGTIGADGLTRMSDGSRPPVGSIVHTQGGDYTMTASGGVKVGGNSYVGGHDTTPVVDYAPVILPSSDGTGFTTRYGGSDQSDNAYRQSLLDANNLPITQFVTRPGSTPGVASASTDLVSTSYQPITGGVMRLDKTVGGEHGTFIPTLGDWTKSADGAIDPAVGDAYSRQNSAYGFTTRYLRGDKVGSTPDWLSDRSIRYDENGNLPLTPSAAQNGTSGSPSFLPNISEDNTIIAAGLNPATISLTAEEKAVLVQALKEMGY